MSIGASDRIIDVDELMRDPEPSGEMLPERLDAEPLGGVRDQCLACFGIGDVGGPSRQPLRLGVELLGQGVERLLGAGGDDDVGPLAQRAFHAVLDEYTVADLLAPRRELRQLLQITTNG